MTFEYSRFVLAGSILLLLLASTVVAQEAQQDANANKPTPESNREAPLKEPAQLAKESPPPALRPWLRSTTEGARQSLANRRPMLVRVGAEWCSWCKRLEDQIAMPEVQTALGDWTLVYLDSDRDGAEVRRMGVGPIPALQVFASDGRLLAVHEGFLTGAELIAFLSKHRDQQDNKLDGALRAQDGGASELKGLFEQLESRHILIREVALSELYRRPQEARPLVVQSLFKGNLAARLAALELLERWNAPIEALDPWRPETLSDAHRQALTDWTATPIEVDVSPTLADRQLAIARETIDRMLRVSDDEATALREQLAHWGDSLVPEVRKRMLESPDDRSRQLLTALKYRLFAGSSLGLRWPGGIERLAALEAHTRRKAADELIARATPAEQKLLLELFADPDPLIREISLRALQEAGGPEVNAALIQRLDDPEPNVRTAILKLLAEKPIAALVNPVGEYAVKEQDADLVVYAVRFLKAANSPSARKAVVKLLAHSSWQVRAEAVEALRNDGDSLADLSEMLDDSEPFVVAKALEALSRQNLTSTAALVRTAKKHPSLAPIAIGQLVSNTQTRPSALKHLREFAAHADPLVRAAAISGLLQVAPHEVEAEALAALADASDKVRIAAADGIFEYLDGRWPAHLVRKETSDDPFADSAAERPTGVAGVLSGFFSLFGSSKSSKQEVAAAVPPAENKPETQPAEQDHPVANAEGLKEIAVPENMPEAAANIDRTEAVTAALDEWLLKHRSVENRTDWIGKTVAPLQSMLQARSASERLSAARALVPLGDEQALSLLEAEAASAPAVIPELARVLRWLPSTQRIEFFEKLLPLAKSNVRNLHTLLTKLAEIPDRHSADAVWNLLNEADGFPSQLTSAAYDVLHTIHFGSLQRRGWDPDESSETRLKRYGPLLGNIQSRAAEGSEAQRVMAIVLLAEADQQAAFEQADALLKDGKFSAKANIELLRVVLAALSPAERHARAIAILESNRPDELQLVLNYLAHGTSSIEYFSGSGLRVSAREAEEFTIHPLEQTPIRVPYAIKELFPRHLQQLADHHDPAVAATAGYLMVLTGEPDGLVPLLRYWRNGKYKDDEALQLVYGAIAVIDDPRYLPILEEIYGLVEKSHQVGEFYWTIRMMSCEGIMELRSKIRKEVEPDRLQ